MYSSDAEFYSSYDWCLNPILTVRDLCARIREELDRRESVEVSWQREETTINLYLFICAVCCAIDDYLAYRPFNPAAIASRFHRISGILTPALAASNIPYTLRTLREKRRVRQWRRDLVPCVDAICEILVAKPESPQENWTRLRSMLQPVLTAQLPARPLLWRMRIPEAFRCQDLSHHDVLAMAKRFAQSRHVAGRSVLVVAPRTAGAYFAPLVKAYLAAQGISAQAWMTLRPKDGVSRDERRELRRLVSPLDCALVVDDHPNTGRTLAMMAALLRRLGAPSENIIMLAPDHSAQLDWSQAVRPTSTIKLPPSEFHKQRLLDDPGTMATVLRQFYSDQGWEDVRVQSNSQIDAMNLELNAHYGDGFHVRLKRVFDVQVLSKDRQPLSIWVEAKSVGWGWLGYHAYIAGTRLHGFVPPMIGLRDGLLFTEWIGELDLTPKPPGTQEVAAVVPLYVAARVKQLRLTEDPCFASVGYRWTGWDRLIKILRRPYGIYIGRLKASAIRARLKSYVSPLPTMVDGRMALSNWLKNATGVYKTDFEQHNFGGAEPDIVDPAYDLASAIEHLDLSESDERQLVNAYVRQTGDDGVNDRILLYKLLLGTSIMEYATYALNRNPSPRRGKDLDRWYLSARKFLTYQMNRHVADSLGKLPPAAWSDRLFFLELDGVFDVETFGDFPHTTPNGLLALRALRSHGYSVVLNTGRSVEHVRNYCQSYELPGGVAEFGSVFVDNVHHSELGLIDSEAMEQLTQCRELAQRLPGVFTDPGCKWAVRVYRYARRETVGLPESEIQGFLKTFKSDKLGVVSREADTHFISKEVTKGTGLLAVKQHLAVNQHPVVAIGASTQDLDMLRLADIAYIPANASAALKALTGNPKYRLVRKPRQSGLLAAVQDLLRDDSSIKNDRRRMQNLHSRSGHLIDELLFAADRPRYLQLFDSLNRRAD